MFIYQVIWIFAPKSALFPIKVLIFGAKTEIDFLADFSWFLADICQETFLTIFYPLWAMVRYYIMQLFAE